MPVPAPAPSSKIKIYFFILFLTLTTACAMGKSIDRPEFHPLQSEKVLDNFIESYKDQVTTVLARSYKKGSGMPAVIFNKGSTGRDIKARCDFSADNKSMKCSMDSVSRDAWKAFEKYAFKQIGQTNSFVF